MSKTFEKYYDATHKLDYFYCVESGDSLWELPEGAVVVDKTEKEDKEPVDQVAQYKARMAALAEAENESLADLV